MKTPNYYHWLFATGVILPSSTAWTGSTTINRPPCSLLRMSKSDNESIDFGRDFPRHNNFSRVVDPNTNNLDVDLAAVNKLINERVLARENKDFRTADNIINQLLTRHAVIINDTDNTWKTGTKRQVKKRPKIAVVGARDGKGPNSRRNHDFKLSPDAGPNCSNLSDDEVIAMIADRRLAQRDRDFKEADNIRHQLKVAGVYVEDGLKEWRADGVPFATGGGHRGHASTSPTSLVRSDYSLAFDNDDDTVTVNSLLAQRTKFKSSGNYEKSDSIRDRLFETYNIRIDDRLGEWSVGGNFGDENNSHWATKSLATKSSEQSRGYKKSATSAELPSAADEEYVQSKVDERMRAKRTRNYDLSDSIRDDLFRMFDVTIHDKINEWSVGGDFGDDSWTHVESVEESIKEELTIGRGKGPNSRSNNDCKLSSDAGPNSSTLSDEEVVAMIADRHQAQRDRNFEEADNIRHQLKIAGVYVDDGAKEWRADGVPFATRGHASTSPTSLVRSEYSLPFNNDDDEVTVNSLLAFRTKFKSVGNYEKSDSIRDRLFESYNIRIDDRLGEWSVGGNFGDENNSHWATTSSEKSRVYKKSATSAELPSAADEEYVQAKVDERMRAKRTRNYDLSDSIRDDLSRRFDVTIHDKILEWSVGGDFESYYADQYSQGQGDVSPPEEIPASLTQEQLACLTVVQLKEKLRDLGAPVSGTKAKLINRLIGLQSPTL